MIFLNRAYLITLHDPKFTIELILLNNKPGNDERKMLLLSGQFNNSCVSLFQLKCLSRQGYCPANKKHIIEINKQATKTCGLFRILSMSVCLNCDIHLVNKRYFSLNKLFMFSVS